MTDSLNVKFVPVGKGRFAVYHRPRRIDFPLLRQMGCTHIITLLKESEGAQRYGDMARAANIEWVWAPLPNGNFPEGEAHDRLIEVMPKLGGGDPRGFGRCRRRTAILGRGLKRAHDVFLRHFTLLPARSGHRRIGGVGDYFFTGCSRSRAEGPQRAERTGRLA